MGCNIKDWLFLHEETGVPSVYTATNTAKDLRCLTFIVLKIVCKR